MSFQEEPGADSSATPAIERQAGTAGEREAGMLPFRRGTGMRHPGIGGAATIWTEIHFWDYVHVLSHRRWTTVAVRASPFSPR